MPLKDAERTHHIYVLNFPMGIWRKIEKKAKDHDVTRRIILLQLINKGLVVMDRDDEEEDRRDGIEPSDRRR